MDAAMDHAWIAMQSSRSGEKISKIKQGLEDMFGFSRKLAHGLNSASSCYEKKTESELTASNPASQTRQQELGQLSQTAMKLSIKDSNGTIRSDSHS
ncbi:unnamed protein product [Rangifer tarandus platyrhynchus]|uniref:Uncharacterized protein n=1 Tax=Rangifer tarandus platyrhynchus TaxID=3082113 RepID=A0AC59YE41_RANTA